MTARIPGAKRGRPRKPKPPKREAGRPEVPLREHPDRYLIARFDVATSWWRVCNGERTGGTMVLAGNILRQGQGAADLRRAGNRFRVMARRFRKPYDIEWRKAIGRAIAFALLTAAEPARNPFEFVIICGEILADAASVGEEEWARRELLPLISLNFPSLKLSERDLLMALACTIAWTGFATEIEQSMAERTGDADSDRTRLSDISRIYSAVPCPEGT